jgi:flagellin FlaB
MKQDNAFTGLEAAIVLIAFVVVAAVFSYVLLGAGFFATQKAQEVTYAGIQQVTSNMFVVGAIYGNTTLGGTGGTVPLLTSLDIMLGIPEGGQPQDAKEVQLLFSNNTGLPKALTYTATLPENLNDLKDAWVIKAIDRTENSGASFDTKLYPGEKAFIHIGLDQNWNITSKRVPGAYSRDFTLEIKPRIGASFLISKTLSTGFTYGQTT